MATTVELYLRDQVIRGELRTDPGKRAVDVLNESPSGVIALAEASTTSVHVKASRTRLGSVRVQRAQVLLVIPYDASPLGPRQLRTAFVEKQPRQVAVGVGPFFVSGTTHVGRYDADWWLEVGLVLVNRGAIGYTGTPPKA